MIRFYYLAFDDEMYSYHSGFTPNWVHFTLFVKDRIPMIEDSIRSKGRDKFAIGYVDAVNSGEALKKIVEQYPESYMDGESMIECFTMHYNDRPCCFTFTETSVCDEWGESGGFSQYSSYDGYHDMAIFESLWHLVMITKLYVKESQIRAFIQDVSSRMAWYMVILLNLSESSSSIGEFTPTFIKFLDDVFCYRKDKLRKLDPSTSYFSIHDQVFDYYRAIIGFVVDEKTITKQEREELNYLYERFLDSVTDDRR